MKQCLPCPSGHSCDSTRATSTPCPDGEYSIETDSECHLCPDGFYCVNTPSGKDYAQCPSGTYSQNGKCESCPSDDYCIAGINQGKCPEELTSRPGSESCELCPPGFACPAYTPCGKGQYSGLGDKECMDCPAGYYCPTGGNINTEYMKICPLGSYCEEGSSGPTKCPLNTYGPSVGLRSDLECDSCPAGYHCEEGTPGYPTFQHICPRGHYCQERTNPVPCPAGKYGPRNGLKEEADCHLCQPGRVCAEGSMQGQPCPTGHYCPQSGQSYAIPCPPGTYNPGTGARDSARCRQCPAGRFCCDPRYTTWAPSAAVNQAVADCRGGTVNPVVCPIGSLQERNGQMSCDYCPPGRRCTTTGLAKPDEYCEYGKFCPLGTGLTGEPCPVGTYNDFNNATSFDDCLDCHAGTYCDSAEGNTYMEDAQKPKSCSPGHYCLARTPAEETFPCPKGTFNDLNGLDSAVKCKNCTAGYFCPRALATSPEDSGALYLCPEGHFCPEGTGGNDTSDPDIPRCPAGTYLDEVGKSRVEDCKECEQGKYCDAGVGAGVACRDGYYSDDYGVTSINDCIKCPAGYKCPGDPNDLEAPVLEPEACGKGKHSASKATECQDCPKGHYCDLNTTTTEAMTYFKVCPEGTFCDVNTDFIPDLVNSYCPLGYWCAKGDVKATGGDPQPCPRGTYGTRTGLTNKYECEPCPAGVYCEEKDDSCEVDRTCGNTCEPRELGDNCDWKECEPGYFCELGSWAPKPCGPGFYRSASDTQAAVNQTSCSICESGHYCDGEGISEPVECPKGRYCPPGSIQPILCDAGTYGDELGYRTSQECKPCEPGYYCPTRGLENGEEYECAAGFYCQSGASVKNPQDGITGDMCPKGRYCPENSSQPESCEAGKFTPFSGAISDADCIECYPGFYCPGQEGSSSMIPCEEGFYCEAGSRTKEELEPCPAGSECPQYDLLDNCDSCGKIGSIHPRQCDPVSDSNNIIY